MLSVCLGLLLLSAKPPGVVIDHSPTSSGLYIGSPSIAILPNGRYVASHDFFGPKSNEFVRAQSVVFGSEDRGRTWSKLAQIDGAFWSTLFTRRSELYLLGTDRHHGNIVIRRSTDGGTTWTSPTEGNTGLLRSNGEWHCGPTPVLEHKGRLWRAFEHRDPPQSWGINYRATMLSAPVGADLLKASSWTASNELPSSRAWNDGDMGAWLEGNAIAAPDGSVVDLLRVQTKSPDEKGAIVRMSEDGRNLTFDPERDFISLPGGAKKFTIRFDPRTRGYWSLATVVHPRHRHPDPGGIRNTLAIIRSADLVHWTVQTVLLYHPDEEKHGFQYTDWLFDGEDIVAVVRTAFDDDSGGAHNKHDANYLTFHRFANFRKLSMKDSTPEAPPFKDSKD